MLDKNEVTILSPRLWTSVLGYSLLCPLPPSFTARSAKSSDCCVRCLPWLRMSRRQVRPMTFSRAVSTRKTDRLARIVANAYVRLASALLGQTSESKQPFAVLSPFLLVALHLPSSLTTPSSPILGFAASSLAQADSWHLPAYHLPSAEEFLRSCWQVLAQGAPSMSLKVALVEAALRGRSIEVKREALAQLAALAEEDPSLVDQIRHTLQSCLLDPGQAGDVRGTVAEILQASTPAETESFGEVESLYLRTTDVPLREALMSVLAGMARSDSERDSVLSMIERWSRISEASFYLYLIWPASVRSQRLTPTSFDHVTVCRLS